MPVASLGPAQSSREDLDTETASSHAASEITPRSFGSWSPVGASQALGSLWVR